ncbi:MAG: DUF4954 family protein [Prevotellaceae bacterium]|jgi:hypothetical protein|nr:DUF4954 family protein [Prevotellaceae bacterium]
MKTYRPLTYLEIVQLEAQHCLCTDWNLIEVSPDFSTKNIRCSRFSGKIRLGASIAIDNAQLTNCDIADNVQIFDSTIFNYTIEKQAFIDKVAQMETRPKARFGNGVRVSVLDETGSRALPIAELLNAPTAYLLATQQHDKKLIAALENLINRFAESRQSDLGTIGKASVIRFCTQITDVNIAANALVEGANLLYNGSIGIGAEVGTGVIARDFIMAPYAKVLDSSQLEACFVGESCFISKAFSATHSLFFANCEMMHGEAVSAFAGPFTVSHHRSSLLIASIFSFFNAGSGSNMSNHAYKLGAMHHGVLRRGSKMASDSYLMLPSRIGAFSVVLTKVKKRIDTEVFPFSYIVENHGDYNLMPAMNTTSVGTYRDCKKWLVRDKRKHADLLDPICFAWLNPNIAQQILTAIETLKTLQEKHPEAASYTHGGCKIATAFVPRAIAHYQMLLDMYVGEILSKNIPASTDDCSGKWLDLAGLVIPEMMINFLSEKLKRGEITNLENWNKQLNFVHSDAYSKMEAAWAKPYLANPETVTENAAKAREKYKNILLADAAKEFSAEAKICFGLDSDAESKNAEFSVLRGKFEENSVVLDIQKEFGT